MGRGHRRRRDDPPRLADRRPRGPRGDRRRARAGRAPDRRRPPPLRDLARLPARGRAGRSRRLRPDGAGLARGPGPDRLPHPPADLGPRRRSRQAGGSRQRPQGALRDRGGPSRPARSRRRRGRRRLRLHRLPLQARLPAAAGLQPGARSGARRALRGLPDARRRDPRGAGPQGHPRDEHRGHRGQARHRLHAEHRRGAGEARRRRLPGGLPAPAHARRAGPRGRRGRRDDAPEVDLLLPQAPHRRSSSTR